MNESNHRVTDVIVVGAGPVGLACAIEVKRKGLSCIVLEKGVLVNSLVGYPTNMQFFSTPSLLEIGDHPFPTIRYKPIREDGIDYYRRVAESEALDIRLRNRVLSLDGSDGRFRVITNQGSFDARKVILATGFFDKPVMLDVPGESLSHVTHYYKEPFGYALQNVVVIGAKNSAAKAALECYRFGARVTVLVRGDKLSDSIKYWIKPDLENRIADGAIKARFGVTIESIDDASVTFREADGSRDSVPADVVLAMTGYRPDYDFLGAMGIAIDEDDARTPLLDEHTFETSRRGLYMAGTVCGGLNTSRWFIENGRHHAQAIATSIERSLARPDNNK